MVEAAMDNSAPIERTAPDTIQLERTLDAPVETVWRYLTEAELRSQWFMGGTDARANSEFELLINHDKLSDDDVPSPENSAKMKATAWHENPVRAAAPARDHLPGWQERDRHL
jgi:uncharacterized protein YndB with AHSA1/START domain